MSKWKKLDIFINMLSYDINLNKIKLFITKKSINHLNVWYYHKDGEVIKRFFILSKGWVKSMEVHFRFSKSDFYNFDCNNITNFEYFFEDNLDIFMCLNEILEYEYEDKEPTIEEIKEVWSNTPKEVTKIFAEAPVMSSKYLSLIFGNGTFLSLEELKKL